MTTPGDSYPWTRQEGETVPAYEAFREYLGQSGERSIRRCADAIGKDASIVSRWSSKWNWVERVRAYDVYLMEAQTDGYANQLASVREKHITLADKLLDHLDTRLDDFITTRDDPTVRWTQAFAAAAKVQAQALSLKESERTTAALDRAEALLEKVLQDKAEA